MIIVARMRVVSLGRMIPVFTFIVANAALCDEASNGGKNFSYPFPAPVVGMPVPMDLKIAETVHLSDIHLRLALRQHEAQFLYTCAVELEEGKEPVTTTLGVPFHYILPDSPESVLSPVHRQPFSKAVQSIQAGINEVVAPYKIVEGAHPQGDAPSLQPIAKANHWITAKMKLKPGKNVFTFRFTVPYQQTFSGTSGKQAQTTMSASTLTLLPISVGAWGSKINSAAIDIYAEEMLPESLVLTDPGKNSKIEKTEKGVISVNFITPDSGNVIPENFSIKVSPSLQFPTNAEDLPEKIDSLGTIFIDQKRFTITNSYSVTATSSLPTVVDGEPGSPENLKTGKGFWAENVSGDGQGESISISLDSPKKLAGLIIQSGASPIILGKADPEALRFPDVAFSLLSRPKRLIVSLNDGEYTFKSTIRDDWNPQLIAIPYFQKSVKSIKITLDTAYPGTSEDSCYITTILPVAY